MNKERTAQIAEKEAIKFDVKVNMSYIPHSTENKTVITGSIAIYLCI